MASTFDSPPRPSSIGNAPNARSVSPIFDGAALRTSSGEGAAARSAALSGSGLRTYTPTLWRMHAQREERPRYERDSLRNRSKEGRPGSRKYRRYTRSVEVTGVLRKAMMASGEDSTVVMDPDSHDGQLRLEEQGPSHFYRLMEAEGPRRALEVWEAAELERRRPRSRPRRERPKTEAQVVEQNLRDARHVFGDAWRYVTDNADAKDLLLGLEDTAARAFSAPSAAKSSGEEWLLKWDGAALKTEAGGPPADELAIVGLPGMERRLVHSLARLLGLLSHSTEDESSCRDGGRRSGGRGGRGGDRNGKVLTVRPPRGRCADGPAWVPPLSLSCMLAAA